MLQPKAYEVPPDDCGHNRGLAQRGSSFGEFALKAAARGRSTAKLSPLVALTCHVKRGGKI
jgi:hypothetical protein